MAAFKPARFFGTLLPTGGFSKPFGAPLPPPEEPIFVMDVLPAAVERAAEPLPFVDERPRRPWYKRLVDTIRGLPAKIRRQQ